MNIQKALDGFATEYCECFTQSAIEGYNDQTSQADAALYLETVREYADDDKTDDEAVQELISIAALQRIIDNVDGCADRINRIKTALDRNWSAGGYLPISQSRFICLESILYAHLVNIANATLRN